MSYYGKNIFNKTYDVLFVVKIVVSPNGIQCPSNDVGNFWRSYTRLISRSIDIVSILQDVHFGLNGSNDLLLLFSIMTKIGQRFANHVTNANNRFAFVGARSWWRLAIPRL